MTDRWGVPVFFPQDSACGGVKIDMERMMHHLTKSVLARILVLFLLNSTCSAEKPEAREVPKGFSLERLRWDVGVLPVETDFIRIRPVDTAKGKVYMLTAGTSTRHIDKPVETAVRVKKTLTTAQCLALYDEAVKLGFFEMRDVYSEEEDGGSASSISITADGVTKKVSVSNTEVPEIDRLTARIRALTR